MTLTDLQTCLANLERDNYYRVVEMLKSSEFETTEVVVYDPDDPGAESNTQPGARYIRKQIANASDAGSAYELLYLAEKQGRKLACAPRVLDCYDIPGYKVVILEYLEGETLDAWIAQHGAGEQTTRLLFPKLCDAVVQLHAAFEPALIHRDIKPSNIIILGDGLATGGTANRTVDGAVDRLAAAGRSDDGVADLSVRLLDFGIHACSTRNLIVIPTHWARDHMRLPSNLAMARPMSAPIYTRLVPCSTLCSRVRHLMLLLARARNVMCF